MKIDNSMMNKYAINGIGEVATLLAEVASPGLKLPNEMQQYIFQVFRLLTHEIALLNLERDRELLMSAYCKIRLGLLELRLNVVVLLSTVGPVRRQVLESIELEVLEMLNLLELTREVCLK